MQTEKSVCQVVKPGPSSVDAADEVCAHCIAGKYPSNLKQHLRKHHPPQSSSWKSPQRPRRKLREKGVPYLLKQLQLTLAQSLSTGTLYKKGSEQYNAIPRKLAIFWLEAQM